VAWNNALENLTGVKAADIIGKGDYEYSIPFYGERRPVLIDQVMTEDCIIQNKYKDLNYQSNVISSEGYVYNLPGGIKYLTGSATALYNSNNEIIGAIEVLKDITERKATELALQESERRLSDIIQFFPDAILVIDGGGKITAWNKAMEEMTGVKAGDMLGKDNYEYAIPFYGERRPILIDLAMKVDEQTEMKYADFDRSGSLITGEAYMPNLRGGQVYLFGTATALYNSQGELVGAIESIRDITERRRAEELLITEKERLAITLRSIGDGVIVTDNSGNIILLNKVAEDLLGWGQSEIVNLPLMDYFHIINARTRMRIKNILQRVFDTGTITELNDKTILINKHGREYIISESAAPVRDKDNNMIGIIIVFRDITEKQKMEDELLKAQKLESIGIIAGGIAHDFNNILTGIIGYISLARMIVNPGERIYNMLSEVEKASLRATNLTQQLLTFSKGWAPIRKTVLINELLKEASVFILSGSNVKCDFYIQDDLWPVEIDEGQITQVINNLVINARQAMPEGGAMEIKAENIEVDFMKNIPLKSGRYLLLSVKDHGTGIPEDIQSKIFDPFFTTRASGNGLGLSTSYSIIRKHDGYITLKSEPGEGTTFYIYLPASDKQARASIKHAHIQESGFSGRVLLMDDEDIIRKTATEMLNFFGLEVDSAVEGDEAYEMFVNAIESGRPYNLVIMDLTIPGGVGGRDAVKKFCDVDPHIKIIVSSGYSNDPILSDYKKYGFSGIVVKPYKMDDLYNQLKKFL
jgi:PAS domain S-box-containing protein